MLNVPVEAHYRRPWLCDQIRCRVRQSVRTQAKKAATTALFRPRSCAIFVMVFHTKPCFETAKKKLFDFVSRMALDDLSVSGFRDEEC